jgi:hypothetical protein
MIVKAGRTYSYHMVSKGSGHLKTEVLGRIFQHRKNAITKKEETMYCNEVHNLCSLSNTVRLSTSIRR